MKKTILILSALTISFTLKAQVNDTAKIKSDTVVYSVESQPEFPGGVNNMERYISLKLKYPKAAIDNNVQGKVMVTFTVDTDGNLTDIKVSQSLSKETDEEAVRVVSHMPKWKPGIQANRAVKCRYTLPVKFQL
jgi:TonB family protein